MIAAVGRWWNVPGPNMTQRPRTVEGLKKAVQGNCRPCQVTRRCAWCPLLLGREEGLSPRSWQLPRLAPANSLPWRCLCSEHPSDGHSVGCRSSPQLTGPPRLHLSRVICSEIPPWIEVPKWCVSEAYKLNLWPHSFMVPANGAIQRKLTTPPINDRFVCNTISGFPLALAPMHAYLFHRF